MKQVVVVGRDTDLWLTTSALGRALAPAGVKVTAVELPTRLNGSEIAATLPPLEALHEKLQIDEADLLRATRGSFSFGQNFVAPGRASFFHAWGAYGTAIEGNAFLPCWLRASRAGLSLPLQAFSPTAIAATNGRVLLPDDATVAFGRTDYGYHVNAIAYVSYLKTRCASFSVSMHQAARIEVERDAADGSIVALTLDGLTRVEADLFIDATGEEALLIQGALEVPRDSWRRFFSVDRMLRARAPAFTSIPPFAEIRVAALGWILLHPSAGGTGIVLAYDASLMSDESAAQLAGQASQADLSNLACSTSHPYVRERVWDRNCVAVGAAACRSDPIHDVELLLLQLGIVHLLALFPASRRFAAERHEYNRLLHSHYARIRDFQCAFYAASSFGGNFWRRARNGAIPEALAHMLATFRARATIAPMEDESFSANSWEAMLIGLGVMPEGYSPAIEQIPDKRLNEEFRRILEFVKSKVLEQPMHSAYLADLCASPRG